jgi:hypothetical protein
MCHGALPETSVTELRGPKYSRHAARTPHVLRWSASASASASALALALALLLSGSVLPGSARACPDCAVGKQARTALWDEQFAYHLVVALLPFLVVGLASYQLNGIGRPDRAREPHTRKRTLR